MPHDFRVYGHLVGLDPARTKAIVDLLSAYECTIDGAVLDFVHEGGFIDIDSDLEALRDLVSPQTTGVIDVINHQDWEMHRWTLADKTLTSIRIHLDNALDTAYASERRA